ncbi:hypothetical protein GRAN_5073 [Granulicella sibirica]|uniref:Uncharacterized protein n=1 Tax=Granulicella sibirica TaxID=2479048 RepID=A0A4V1L507_9BACT|nr:hypothetical protein GRAN_5073 [Granulicella sibirica]
MNGIHELPEMYRWPNKECLEFTIRRLGIARTFVFIGPVYREGPQIITP